MATSSIFENFFIQGENNARRFVSALEASANEPRRIISTQVSEPVTDASKLRELFGLENSK